MPHEDGFRKNKNPYIKSVYYSICDDYDTNANEIWMNGDWFYTGTYAVFNSGGKPTRRSPPHKFTQLIITQCKGFMRKGIAKVSRPVREYEIYLFPNSQVLTRSVVNAQQIFNTMFNVLINKDYSIGAGCVLEHSLSQADKILISNIDMKIGSNKTINGAKVYHKN